MGDEPYGINQEEIKIIYLESSFNINLNLALKEF